MERDKFLSNMNNQQYTQGNIYNYLELIEAYCIEQGKERELINNLLQILQTPQFTFSGLFHIISEYVLEYYKLKFNIVTIRNKKNQIIKYI